MSIEERVEELERQLKELQKTNTPTLWPLEVPIAPAMPAPYTPGYVPYIPPVIGTGTPFLPWRGSTIC